MRVQDTMGRLGGEEFAVLLPRASVEQAQGVAERLRKLLVDHPLRLTDENVALTASIGVTLLRPGESPEVALGRADQAMYQAKSEGRNRVVSVLAPVRGWGAAGLSRQARPGRLGARITGALSGQQRQPGASCGRGC